jgi:hypothetical protein
MVAMRRVYIHVGLPKTGTSYVQKSLQASKGRLSEAGVLVPGDDPQFQRRAVWDLLGRRLQGVDHPDVPGAWQALVASVVEGQGDRAVLSEELLVHAGRRVAQRVVRDLAPAEVHIIVTVRDLARVLASMWQQQMAKRRTWPWPVFVAAVGDPKRGPSTAGVAFWLRYDLHRTLATWASVVPAHRIHVVVVPDAGSAPSVLLERFAAAADLNPALLTAPDRLANTSVGMVGAELLRRVNLGLGQRLNESQYLHVVHAIKHELRRHSGGPIPLPREARGWVNEASTAVTTLLKDGPYDVVGDLDDLLPATAWEADAKRAPVTDRQLADVAIAALTVVAEKYGDTWSNTRNRRRGSKADRRTRLSSSARSLAFRSRVRALNAADSNQYLARAAAWYLRRSAGGGPRMPH